ncbi:MAG: DNA-binding transcriptional regulator YiaG [Planctomycetota bacterium]|jgi:DNA-binding transcriptional regulator YiaG
MLCNPARATALPSLGARRNSDKVSARRGAVVPGSESFWIWEVALRSRCGLVLRLAAAETTGDLIEDLMSGVAGNSVIRPLLSTTATDAQIKTVAPNERHARIVELRFFTGLSIPQTADTLLVSHATVERDWFMARAWLRVELGRAQPLLSA